MTADAAHVSDFSHGSGLLVYINGALMSAARVALKINIATLEFVKRLHLEQLVTIAACLGAAFGDADRPVDISWAEVGSETEREWREAEREWEEFSGGPYEALAMEGFDEEAFLRQNVRRIQHARYGSMGQDGWAAFLRHRSPTASGKPRPMGHQTTYSLSSTYSLQPESSPQMMGFQAVSRALGTDAELDIPPTYSGSFSGMPGTCKDVEMIMSKQSRVLDGGFKVIGSEKEHAPLLWSPGKGTGPIMSSAEFDALPDWSDVEDNVEWDGAL